MSTKTKILRAATDVIADKGYQEARLEDIASRAGISPPAIYKHFKNKEDILFNLTTVKSVQDMERFEKDLQGVQGPTNLIRKLLWAMLDQYRQFPKETIILLLECRANHHYYQSEAYQIIKKFARTFGHILENGCRAGEFDPDLNIAVARDLILGALDQTALDGLVLKKDYDIANDFDDLFRLFLALAAPEPHGEQGDNGKRKRLLDAALGVFAQKGYHGATISEIAKRADVSDGIVYEYFTNKEDLLLSVANRKIQEDVNRLDEMFTIREPRRKLRRFIKYHCGLYMADRNYLKLFLLLIQTNRRFLARVGRGPYEDYNRFILDIIHEGREQGIFRKDVSPGVFRNMILGGINHVFLRWFIVPEGRDTDKLEEIEVVTNLLTRAVAV